MSDFCLQVAAPDLTVGVREIGFLSEMCAVLNFEIHLGVGVSDPSREGHRNYVVPVKLRETWFF